MLPGVADAAVYLDVELGAEGEGGQGEAARDRGGKFSL